MEQRIRKLKLWFQQISDVLTDYHAKVRVCEQKILENTYDVQKAVEVKEQEWKKAENLLNAAYHIANEKYVGNIPKPEVGLQPIPFERSELTKKMFATEQACASNLEVEQLLKLIYANRLWIEKERQAQQKENNQYSGLWMENIRQETINTLEQLISNAEMVVILKDVMKNYYENTSTKENAESNRCIYMGLEKCLEIPELFTEVFERYFGILCREQSVYLPVIMRSECGNSIKIDYDPNLEYEAEAVVNHIMLEMLRKFEGHFFRISVLDPVRFSENSVNLFREMIGNDGFILPIPRKHEDIMQRLESIIQKGEKHSKERQVLVLKSFPQKYDHRELEIIQQLTANRYEYNLQFIIMHQNEYGQRMSLGGNEKQLYDVYCDCTIIFSNQQCTINRFGTELEAKLLSIKNEDSQSVQYVISACKEKYASINYTNEYHKIYDLKDIPAKKIREIQHIPFGIDEEGNIGYCDFENENFSAYISGVSRSGKSTCLHSLINGIVRNYHPDVAELWLLDFKMMEFREYALVDLPHIKYLLLEESDELVVDILTKATDELYRRQNVFNYYGFKRLSDVPMDMYMPSIFIIIDEFAQVSQVIRKLSFSGNTNYMEMLENLLAKGAALGFKFIFADQGFVDGVAGLTQKARNQMQMRFAFRNKPLEVEQTLGASSEELTDEIKHEINNLPPHYVLFKSRDDQGEFHIKKYHGLNLITPELRGLLKRISENIVDYVDKKPVKITGGAPKEFMSQRQLFEHVRDKYRLENEDEEFLIFPGTPMNMERTFAIPLWHGMGENILMAGGDVDGRVSVMLSVAESLLAEGWKVEIHSYQKNICYQKKRSIFRQYSCNTDTSVFYNRICQLSKNPEEKCILICLGLEDMLTDIELSEKEESEENQNPKVQKVDLFSQMQRCVHGEVTREQIDQLNQELRMEEEKRKLTKGEMLDITKFRGELRKLMTQGTKKGLHFMLMEDDAECFEQTKMDLNAFHHKLLFRMNMQASFKVCKSSFASEVKEGKVLYVGIHTQRMLRPYLYNGLTIDRWRMNENQIPEIV